MKILVATSYYPPSVGGMQYQNLDIARGLVQLGRVVTVLAPTSPGADAFDAREPYPIIRMPVEHGPASVRRLVVGVRYLLRAWRQVRPAVVLTLDDRIHEGYGFAWPLMPFRPICLTVQSRLIWPGSLMWRMARNYALTTTFRRAHRILAVTNASKETLVRFGIDSQKIDVVYLGIDEALFLDTPPTDRLSAASVLGVHEADGRPTVLTAARLEDEKGIDAVIDAIVAVRRHVPTVLCLVVGEGPDRDRLLARAAALGLQHHIRFLGSLSRDHLIAAYDLCDVFVLLSRRGVREVFPLVCLEAAARGRPVIGSRQGGIPEQVVHGQTGLLVDHADVPAIAEAVVALLIDSERRGQMGQAGRKRVRERFTRARMVQSIDATLQRCVVGAARS